MKLRLNISNRIGLGFGVLIFLALIVFIITQLTLSGSRSINDKIINENVPSRNSLENLYKLVERSKLLITNWVYIQGSIESQQKIELRLLLEKDYPELKFEIKDLSENWSEVNKRKVKHIFSSIDSLFLSHRDIMQQLNAFEKYEDPSIILVAKDRVDEGDIDKNTKRILKGLSNIIYQHNEEHRQLINDMHHSFLGLQAIVISSGILLVIGGVLIAYFTGKSIIVPVLKLRKTILLMAKGILPKKKIEVTNDEIGEMSDALNNLVTSINRTTEFSKQIGSGDFKAGYQPLSKFDELGYALLKMRDDLKESERELEIKVVERTKEVVRQKEELELQSKKMETLYKDVTDSIRYAKHIQAALLPSDEFVSEILPESFIFYKPKDIVCGDFYWIKKIGKKKFFATVDCTGHGVPGAFISIVGHNLIEEVAKSNPDKDAGFMLTELNRLLTIRLKQSEEISITRDGMDMSLCIIDEESDTMSFAGAFNPLYLYRNNELINVKGDPFPVGIFLEETMHNFTNYELKIQKNDMIYIFTDGYTDQFGGPHDKKFKRKRFRDLLRDIHQLQMHKQRFILNNTFEAWKGINNTQTDDILIMGVRVT